MTVVMTIEELEAHMDKVATRAATKAANAAVKEVLKELEASKPPVYMTAKQIAKHFNVTRRTIAEWVKEDKISPATDEKQGNAYQYTISQFQKHVK